LTKSLSTLREYFYYSEGELYWKKSPKNGINKGDVAGSTLGDGYRSVQLLGQRYMAHNIIYLLEVGDIPPGYIVDHRDRDPLNNNKENLRLATTSQNQGNRAPKTVWKGVNKYRNGKYRASIGKDGKTTHIGYFHCPREAALAYNLEAEKYWGEFAVYNNVFEDVPLELLNAET
jgi:hypothetical protein